MPRKQSAITESVIFNGVTFRRYTNAKNPSDRKYYRADGRLHNQGIIYLHREVWKFYNGEIPEGYHIHHKDGNSLNNDISNLELVEGHEHLSVHVRENLADADYYARSKKHMEIIREQAKEWHGSDEGREWHRQHGLAVARKEAEKPKVKCICIQCGKEFYTPSNKRNQSKYCSNACCAKYRRDNGLDDETRICVVCGKEFRTNRYGKTKTCSRECGSISSKNTRRKKQS